MLDWNLVGGEFHADGSLRDIYILGTTMEHWQQALDALRSSSFRVRYFRSEVEHLLPCQTSEAFPKPGWADRLLSVNLHGPIAKTHFFTEKEIEFDLDPEEIRGQRDLNCVLQFMHLLADATERETILTPENGKLHAIFRVLPHDRRIVYHRSS